ncbi:U4/U6 small nuclear ribonucleoprotein PRP4 [Penicillium sp. IBT 18751x]|nr:U4/U6 small nuclear ribonucleoprotein PRP4 [Penicillium sp. IBT 18751x]
MQEPEEEGGTTRRIYIQRARTSFWRPARTSPNFLCREQRLDESNIPLRTHVKYRKEGQRELRAFDLYGSQIAGDRPISICRFAPDGQLLRQETGAEFPIWRRRPTLKGHTDRVGGLSWFPGATLPESNVSPSSEEKETLTCGHSTKKNPWQHCRVTLAVFAEQNSTHQGDMQRRHPSILPWRLWDVETTTELLLQEGHSREVYAVGFNSDGSLLASGGLDSIGRIWDVRIGQTVMILEGHIREIYGLDWGVDGYRVLSGAADGWVKCWDLRQVRSTGGIGAHKSVVSDLRWYKGGRPSPRII